MKRTGFPSIIGTASHMFNCQDSINSLLAFLDGEMSAEEEQHLRAHLEGCPPCVEFVRTYRATSGMCRRALVKHMPPEVGERLRSFLRTKLESK